jgi:hypothetical protein
MAISKEKLTANRIATEEVPIPGMDPEEDFVVVRGLSRAEMHVGKTIEERKGGAAQEAFLLSRAMVDPPLTEAEAAEWQKGSPFGEINTVQLTINRLSGIGKGAAKSDVPGDGAGPDSGV